MIVLKRTPLLFLGLIAMMACEGIVESEEERRVGVISFSGDPIVIDLPDTLYAGIPFETAIRTYAGGCDSMGPTKTGGEEGVSVDITPYDFFYTGRGACPAILKLFDHRVNIVLLKTGVHEFRFHGRSSPEDSVVTVVREVLVR